MKKIRLTAELSWEKNKENKGAMIKTPLCSKTGLRTVLGWTV